MGESFITNVYNLLHFRNRLFLFWMYYFWDFIGTVLLCIRAILVLCIF